tara:strand:- start:311 stop:502 length:192 start_codon:yes stop_codon:yes gene_type:complete
MKDERISFFWIQTSRTGRSNATMSAEEYFNKITRNNQGNIKLLSGDKLIDFDNYFDKLMEEEE